MYKPKVSVIIPNYNSCDIIEGLKVLDKEEYKNFEVIVVDDCSSNDCGLIVSNFIKNKKKFKQICLSENKGPAVARNIGAKSAEGDILLFTDSDCKPCKSWISKMVKPFSDSNVVGVSGTYKTWNKDKLVARFVGYEIALRHERLKSRENIDFIGTFCAGYKRDVFLRVGGFDEKFRIASGEDTELSYRLSSLGYKMKFVSNAYVFHKHPDNLSWYMKQKFGRGFWRVRLYNKHKSKIKGESYTPFSVLIQIPIMVCFMFFSFSLAFLGFSSLVIGLFNNAFFGYGFYLIFGSILVELMMFIFGYIINLAEGFKMFKYEKKMVLVAPFILSLRSISSALGVIFGIFRGKF
jgi:cellulose synthase/poly-beta-1,6-N-acetylglucosamine synthase-like glycosyltransferase